MKEEKINIAIAEACGLDVCNGFIFAITPHLETGETVHHPVALIPDYCNDLNAMHEAEELIPDKYDRYEYFLKLRLGDEWGYATARQRAEAFLRTIGKWEDSE